MRRISHRLHAPEISRASVAPPGLVAEDLGIGAAQVVAVEQRQVNGFAGDERAAPRRRASEASGGGEIDQFVCGQTGQQLPRRLLRIGDAGGDGMDGGQLARAGQQFPAPRRGSPAAENFAPWASRAAEGTPERGEHFEAGDGDYRICVPFGQAFHGAEAHAHAGKAAGAVDGDDCAEQPNCVSAEAKKIGDGGDERGRSTCARQALSAQISESPKSRPSATEPDGPQVSIARSKARSCMAARLYCLQRLIEVGDQVFLVLDADGEADAALVDAHLPARLLR